MKAEIELLKNFLNGEEVPEGEYKKDKYYRQLKSTANRLLTFEVFDGTPIRGELKKHEITIHSLQENSDLWLSLIERWEGEYD